MTFFLIINTEIGIQHYSNVNFFTFPLQYRQYLDNLKLQLCKKAGISVVTIPYWWDLNIETLKATIYQIRPDLFTEKPNGKFIVLLSFLFLLFCYVLYYFCILFILLYYFYILKFVLIFIF